MKIEGVVDDEIHFPRAPLAAAMIAHVNGIETALETAPSLQQKDMQQMEVWAKALPEITRSSGQGRG